MHEYEYDGPVMEFNTLLTNRWRGVTKAPSEQIARRNLMYQFKKSNNKIASAKIVLPGKIKMVN